MNSGWAEFGHGSRNRCPVLESRQPLSVIIVGLVALLIGAALVVKVASDSDWDLTALVAFGEEEPSTLEYARLHLGHVVARDSIGHDGRFFFIQANDPFLLRADEHAQLLDRPTYRAQRMFYPLLAGLGGLATPSVVVWGLVVVNLLAMAAGAAALGSYAQSHHMSRWFGLAFPLNPGLMSELTLDGAGVLAFALTCAAVLSVSRGRHGWAVGLLALSALTREVMLVAAFGIALWLWRSGHRRQGILHAFVPMLAVVLWAIYVRVRLPGVESVEIQEIGWPLAGVVEAFGTWISYPELLAVGLAVILCLLLFASQLVRGRSDLLAYATMGFLALAVLLTRQVWEASFDITRAVAPLLTALIVSPLLFGCRERSFTATEA